VPELDEHEVGGDGETSAAADLHIKADKSGSPFTTSWQLFCARVGRCHVVLPMASTAAEILAAMARTSAATINASFQPATQPLRPIRLPR
jgi:hypothetical protein